VSSAGLVIADARHFFVRSIRAPTHPIAHKVENVMRLRTSIGTLAFRSGHSSPSTSSGAPPSPRQRSVVFRLRGPGVRPQRPADANILAIGVYRCSLAGKSLASFTIGFEVFRPRGYPGIRGLVLALSGHRAFPDPAVLLCRQSRKRWTPRNCHPGHRCVSLTLAAVCSSPCSEG